MLPSQVYRTSYELRWLDAGFLQSGHLQLDGSLVEYLQSGHFPGWKILSPGGGFVPLCDISEGKKSIQGNWSKTAAIAYEEPFGRWS
jgi:hypothetical protein